eukprot:TRINITY_DN9237_c0_g1_i1.p1 TRINITY_DN9237_c0_g1~~TRINITY_DN9237_c0_g1_i1.p1  ORF type:complete len:504 (+),score=110.30 TRINITY_DN9237_c0_g1_i1:42-1553(+)
MVINIFSKNASNEIENVCKQWYSKEIHLDDYEDVCLLGRGRYGEIHKGKDREQSNRCYALKKLKEYKSHKNDDENSGKQQKPVKKDPLNFPCNSYREVLLLKHFVHQNIVKLHEVGYEKDENSQYTWMIFEYCPFDMAGLLKLENKSPIYKNPSCLRYIILSLLQAIDFLHENMVIHRDLKPANLFFTKEGILKVGDFGLGRKLTEFPCKLTPNLVSEYYRAPEIFYGSNRYDYGVDIWSIGCIMAELIIGRKLFHGTGSIEIIDCIHTYCGYPILAEWEELMSYNKSKVILKRQERLTKEYSTNEKLRNLLGKEIPPGCHAVDLICKMLSVNPKHRITAKDALKHPFFKGPIRRPNLNGIPALHDYNARGTISKHSERISKILERNNTPHQPLVNSSVNSNPNTNKINKDGNKIIEMENDVSKAVSNATDRNASVFCEFDEIKKTPALNMNQNFNQSQSLSAKSEHILNTDNVDQNKDSISPSKTKFKRVSGRGRVITRNKK